MPSRDTRRVMHGRRAIVREACNEYRRDGRVGTPSAFRRTVRLSRQVRVSPRTSTPPIQHALRVPRLARARSGPPIRIVADRGAPARRLRREGRTRRATHHTVNQCLTPASRASSAAARCALMFAKPAFYTQSNCFDRPSFTSINSLHGQCNPLDATFALALTRAPTIPTSRATMLPSLSIAHPIACGMRRDVRALRDLVNENRHEQVQIRG